jgi:Tfp pilus assembly protein PilV
MRNEPVVRTRSGLTLVEVIVALGILGGVMLALAMFSVRLSQATSSSRMRITAAQFVADRLEFVKGISKYDSIEAKSVATENISPPAPYSGSPFVRQTWVTRIGGAVTDTIDYKIITVQVSNPQMSTNVRKTTVIAPF